MATPELAARYPDANSLREAPLLFDDSLADFRLDADWSTWFRAVGIDFTPEHGSRFSQSDHVVDAAMAGAGIALGRRSMVVTELHQGRLVAPYGIALLTGARFRFLCRLGTETQPHIAAFRDWVLGEVEKTASSADGFQMVPVADVKRRSEKATPH